MSESDPVIEVRGVGEHEHGQVTVELWPLCRALSVCPWCNGDTKSHGLKCNAPRYDGGQSEKVFLGGLRQHELETLRNFVVLAASAEPDHFWLQCKRPACAAFFHVRKPPPIPIVHVFERERPIASDRPIEVRPEGLCFGDWGVLENHNVRHQRDSGWW